MRLLVVIAVTEPIEPMERDRAGQGLTSNRFGKAPAQAEADIAGAERLARFRARSLARIRLVGKSAGGSRPSRARPECPALRSGDGTSPGRCGDRPHSRPRRLPPLQPEGLPGYFRLSTVDPSLFKLQGKRRDARDNHDGSRAERLGQDECAAAF
jgi:hypothetical protein